MRTANVTAAVAAFLWFSLVLIGRDGEGGVASRMAGDVNIRQFDYYALWPAYVVIGLLACAWGCNLFRRWSWLLTDAAVVSLLALLPYLIIYGGGM